MEVTSSSNQEFFNSLKEIIRANYHKENFGVNDLARAAGMTSFTLRRKLHSVSNNSINQLIREVRLQKAMEIIQQEDITASEVAYKVGFGSPAYFTKCFHEYFGYPPGEAKNRNYQVSGEENGIIENNIDEAEKPLQKNAARKKIIYTVGGILILIIVYLVFNNISFKSFSLLPGNHLKSEDKSIAVLPFNNLSNDEENQYFADGVMEDILNLLQRIEELQLISKTSVEQFRGSTESIPEIAKKLGVNFILEGSILRYEDNIRINVRLIDARHDRQIFSKPYNTEFADIFKIRTDIAKEVAAKMETVLSTKEKELISKIPTQNPDAYPLYLTGRYFLNLRKEEDLYKSLYNFEKALALDPNYAEAYAGMADAYLLATNYRWYRPTREGYAKTRELIKKALELDNSLADAHATYGALLCFGEWNWKEAEEELQLAIRLNPKCQTAHQYSYDLMVWLNRFNEAREHIDIALKLNPISPYLILKSAWLYSEVGNYEKVLEECNKIFELDSMYYTIYWVYFNVFRKMGEDGRAIGALQKALSFYPEDQKYAVQVKDVYQKCGMEGIFKLLLECEFENSGENAISIAKLYLNLGEKEKALDWLEKAMELRIPFILDINYLSDYDSIRNEPRFKALLDKMGLTPYQKKSK